MLTLSPALPSRLLHVTRTILRTIRSQNIPLELSVFSPSSLHRLFPTHNILRPNTLVVALFPYLRHQPYVATLPHAHAFHVSTLEKDAEVIAGTVLSAIRATTHRLWAYATYPFDLVQGECLYKRKELERIRNDRATKLGELSSLRAVLSVALENPSDQGLSGLAHVCWSMQNILDGPSAPNTMDPVPESINVLASTVLPSHMAGHRLYLAVHGLRRPSRLTLLWPKIVFLPPFVLYLVRSAYVSRASLAQLASDTVDTIKDFWEDWLIAPLKDVVKTVRAGTDDGVIVARESVKADLDVSLFVP